MWFFLQSLRPKLIGWVSYFRKSEVRGVFKELDSWIRRKLRAILWRQLEAKLDSSQEPHATRII